MAIVRGNTVPGEGSNNTFSVALDAGSNADRAVFVSIVARNITYTITSSTYGAVAGTVVPGSYVAENPCQGVIVYFKGVASGSNTLTVNFSASVHFGYAATAYSGVDGTTAIGTAATANFTTVGGTTATVDVSSATGEVVIDVVGGTEGSTPTPGANQTPLWVDANIDAGWASGGQSEEAGAATVTMSWTASPTTSWLIAAVPIKPAGAGTTPITVNTLVVDSLAGGEIIP